MQNWQNHPYFVRKILGWKVKSDQLGHPGILVGERALLTAAHVILDKKKSDDRVINPLSENKEKFTMTVDAGHCYRAFSDVELKVIGAEVLDLPFPDLALIILGNAARDAPVSPNDQPEAIQVNRRVICIIENSNEVKQIEMIITHVADCSVKPNPAPEFGVAALGRGEFAASISDQEAENVGLFQKDSGSPCLMEIDGDFKVVGIIRDTFETGAIFSNVACCIGDLSIPV